MTLKDNFLRNIYKNIIDKLPTYVLISIKKLIPFYIISSLFEIIGLVVLLPVINVIIDSSMINRSPYLSFLYNKMGFTSQIKFAIFLLSVTTVIFLLKNLTLFIISKVQNKIIFGLANRLSYEKYDSYLEKDYEFHAENNPAVLLRNMIQIPFELVIYVVQPFVIIINEIFILVLIFSGIALYDLSLFLSLTLFVSPFIYLYNKFFKKLLSEISKNRDTKGTIMHKTGLQSMENYREIIVTNKKYFFKSFFKNAMDSFTSSTSRVSQLNLLTPRLVETISILSIFTIFITGYFLNRDITSLAQFLIVFSVAAYRLIPSLNKLIQSSNYIKSSYFVFDYFNKSDFNKIAPEHSSETLEKINFNKKIELRNLCFYYKKQKYAVLNNVNLSIEKGETIGIIGPSGSGKTTLLNILLRLYEENEGGIYVDDIKIKKDNLSCWYNTLSFVPQNVVLLDGTILENIAFGIDKKNIDYLKLEKVIIQAQLESFVKNTSDGINSRIGEKGIKISGGQRQRIGIARALFRGSEILVFDEATSSLDLETEMLLTEAIYNISNSNLTMIIVAHRIQTLKYCNKIYKLENGKLNLIPSNFGETMNYI